MADDDADDGLEDTNPQELDREADVTGEPEPAAEQAYARAPTARDGSIAEDDFRPDPPSGDGSIAEADFHPDGSISEADFKPDEEDKHGMLSNFLRGISREVALGFMADPLKGLGRLTGSDTLKGWGEGVEHGLDDVIAPPDKDSIMGGIGKGVGDMLPMIAAGAATGGAGLAARIVVPLLVGGIQMGLSGVEQQSEAAEAKGASPEDVKKAGYAGGVVGGVAGTAFGAAGGRLLQAVERSAGGFTNWATTVLQNAVREGAVFAGVGEAQEYLNNEIAKAYYDPKSEFHFDLKRLATEFGTGAVIGGGKQIVSGGYRPSNQRVEGGDQEAARDQQVGAQSQVPNVSRGTATEQAAPVERPGEVGNPASTPVRDQAPGDRSERAYEKRRQRLMGRGEEGEGGEGGSDMVRVEPGEVPADQAMALARPDEPLPPAPTSRSATSGGREIENGRRNSPGRENPEPAQAPAQAPAQIPQGQNSIPFMITQGMKANLRARGISDAEIKGMTPAQAHQILNNPNPVQPPRTNAIPNREPTGNDLPPAPRMGRAPEQVTSIENGRRVAPARDVPAGEPTPAPAAQPGPLVGQQPRSPQDNFLHMRMRDPRDPQEQARVRQGPPQVNYPRQPVRPQAWDNPIQGTMTIVPELRRSVRVEGRYDVPWLAGTSNDGRTVYTDPRLPRQIDVGGRMLDPRQPIIRHELVERVHEQQMSRDPKWANASREAQYEEAHKRATRDEEAMMARQGYTPEQIKSYQDQMQALAEHTERERPADRHPPPDLWTKPYPAAEARALTREGGHPEGMLEVSRAQREGVQRTRERMADQQKGELFTQDVPATPSTERPAAPAREVTARAGAAEGLQAARERVPAKGAEMPTPVREAGPVRTREGVEPPASQPKPKKAPGSYPIRDARGNEVGQAKSEVAARTRSNSLRIADETMNRFKPEREYDPRKPEDVKELREWARGAVEHAKGEGWTKYMPRRDEGGPHLKAPRESLWMDEVKAFAAGKRKVPDFLAREKLLRAGDEGATDIVREQRFEEGSARMKRNEPTVEDTEKGIGVAQRKTSDLMSAKDEAPAPVKRIDPNSPEGKAIAERALTSASKKPAIDAKPQETKFGGETITPVRTRKVSEVLAEHFGERQGHGIIAKRVSELDPNIPVHEVSKAEMDRVAKKLTGDPAEGLYDPNSHAILVPEGHTSAAVLHEAVHGVTSRQINNNPAMARIIRGVMDHVRNIDETLKEGNYAPAFKNEKEFLAFGMTDPVFQTALARVKVSPEMAKTLGLGEKITNGFQAFVDAVRRVLGMKPGEHNALEAVVKLTDMASKAEPAKEFGRRAPPDAMVQEVKDKGEGLLKQAKAPWLMKLRDTDKIVAAADRLFGGPDNNPLRKVSGSIEKAAKKAREIALRDAGLLRKDTELQEQYKAEYPELERLMQMESQYQRNSELPLNKQGFNTSGPNKAQRDSHHPEMERMWNALPDDLKDHRANLYDFTEQRHAELAEETAGARLITALGIDDKALAKRFMNGTHTEAEYQKLGKNNLEREAALEMIQDAGKIAHIIGPYTPFMRRGQYAVTGLFKTPGSDLAFRKLDDNTFEFKTKKEAEDFAIKQHGDAAVSSHYVALVDDPTHGVKAGNNYSTKSTEVTRNGKPVEDPQGATRMYDREVPLVKGDPNTEQRFKVRVQRDYLSMLDTYRDALAHKKELDDLGFHEKTDVQNKRYQPHTDAITLASNLTNLKQKLKDNILYQNMGEGQKKVVEQALAEHYLQMLAATRVNSSKLHRKNVRGADDNLLRNMHDYSMETANRLAQTEYQPAIDKGLKDAQKMVDADNTMSQPRNAVLNEIRSRVNDMKGGGFKLASGQMGPAMHRLMGWSYMARLATPGFTIRNLTQPGLFTLPEVGSKHGFAATGREMMRVYKDINAGKTLWGGIKDTGQAVKGKLTDPETFVSDIRNRLKDPQEKKALDEMVKTGGVDADAGFQISEYIQREGGVRPDFAFGRSRGISKDNPLSRGIEHGLTGADKALHWMEEVSRQMPRAAETVNRAVTGLTAYRLEMKRNGGDFDKAVRYANDVLDQTQFRYTDTNKPTWQRHPFARMAFQFKQFGKSTYEMMGRHIGNVVRNEQPGDRTTSLKALGGLFVTHTMMAGALGLPWEPVRAMLVGAKSVGITNKEWDDVENGIREGLTGLGKLAGLNEPNSKKLGEVMARGLPRLLGMDMSPGLGLDNMLLFGSPRSGTDREFDSNMKAWLFQMVGGAPASLVMQTLDGMRDVSHGEYAKGVEKLMPVKIGSDVIKAGVGFDEGKVNARGRQTMSPYSPAEAVTKAMGIPVAREAEQNAYAHSVYNEGTENKDARSKLINDWVKASGDAKTKAFEAATKEGILPKDLTAAAQRERSAQKRMVDGVVTTKATKPIAERLRRVYNLRNGTTDTGE